MATIHEAQMQGCIVLSNVTVTRVFPRDPGKALFILVTDPTVQAPTGLKIWGNEANFPLQVGSVITLTGQGPKGGIKNTEYPAGSGKWTLNANDCKVTNGGGQPAQQQATPATDRYGGASDNPTNTPQATPAQYGEEAPKPQTLSDEELEARMRSYARKACLFGRIMVDEYVMSHGFTKEEAIQMSNGGGSGLYPQSWFLKKGF